MGKDIYELKKIIRKNVSGELDSFFDYDTIQEVVDYVTNECETTNEYGFQWQMKLIFQKLLIIAKDEGKLSVCNLFSLVPLKHRDSLFVGYLGMVIAREYLNKNPTVTIKHLASGSYYFEDDGKLEDAILDFLDDFPEGGVAKYEDVNGGVICLALSLDSSPYYDTNWIIPPLNSKQEE